MVESQSSLCRIALLGKASFATPFYFTIAQSTIFLRFNRAMPLVKCGKRVYTELDFAHHISWAEGDYHKI